MNKAKKASYNIKAKKAVSVRKALARPLHTTVSTTSSTGKPSGGNKPSSNSGGSSTGGGSKKTDG